MTPPASSNSKYVTLARCGNCGYENRIKIPVGTLLKEHPCPVCDCPTLSRPMSASPARRDDGDVAA
jgi:hypothetical protein